MSLTSICDKARKESRVNSCDFISVGRHLALAWMYSEYDLSLVLDTFYLAGSVFVKPIDLKPNPTNGASCRRFQ